MCTDDNSLCCMADYQVHSLDDQFSIGVFSGLHSKGWWNTLLVLNEN